jgi:hypothetical protein
MNGSIWSLCLDQKYSAPAWGTWVASPWRVLPCLSNFSTLRSFLVSIVIANVIPLLHYFLLAHICKVGSVVKIPLPLALLAEVNWNFCRRQRLYHQCVLTVVVAYYSYLSSVHRCNLAILLRYIRSWLFLLYLFLYLFFSISVRSRNTDNRSGRTISPGWICDTLAHGHLMPEWSPIDFTTVSFLMSTMRCILHGFNISWLSVEFQISLCSLLEAHTF